MFLGIEIGGTKLQLGVGAGDGTLAALWRGTVEPTSGADGIRRQIMHAVPELLAQADLPRARLLGIGVGFGGPVDDVTRTVIKSHQIHGWDGFPLADWLGDLLELPAALGNDADVAGLAEALFGAGAGCSPIFYVTVGSGIGGGLVLDGRIHRGTGRGAAEIGHLRLSTAADDPAGVAADAEDVLEHYASGWAIARHAERFVWLRRIVDPDLVAAVEGPGGATARLVAEAAARGDSGARDVLDFATRMLARALGQVIALVCPRRIVIGGGVPLMGEALFFAPLRRAIAERVFTPFAECYDVVPAALGEAVVVHGALALARQQFGA